LNTFTSGVQTIQTQDTSISAELFVRHRHWCRSVHTHRHCRVTHISTGDSIINTMVFPL